MNKELEIFLPNGTSVEFKSSEGATWEDITSNGVPTIRVKWGKFVQTYRGCPFMTDERTES